MKRRFILSVILALVLILSISVPALAANSANVTVTATPEYIAITNAPDNWTVNDEGLVGGKTIVIATEYWSNPISDTTTPSDPVVDGECHFTITNTSSVAIDLTVNFPHFTGGDAMQNGGTGSGGVGSFGAYCYCTGMTYSTGKVVCLTTGSAAMKSGLAATTNIMWGLSCDTQTDVWTSGSAMSATPVTITATAS